MNKKIIYIALWVCSCWLIGSLIFFITTIYTKWFDEKCMTTQKTPPISMYIHNTIPIHLWLPTGSSSNAPLIIFSHGYALDCSWYSFIINDLVSHGYVVIGIDHPHLARTIIMPNGTTISYQKPTFIHKQDKENKIGMALDQYVLNIDAVYQQLIQWNSEIGHLFYNRLNMDKCIVMGHSLGGAASIAYGTYNNKIAASISLDGFYTPWNERKINSIPLLYLSAEPQSTHQKERLAAVQKQALKQPITIHTINEAGHNAFCDAILWNKAKRWWYATIMPVGSIHSNTGIELIQKHIRTFCEQINISIQKK